MFIFAFFRRFRQGWQDFLRVRRADWGSEREKVEKMAVEISRRRWGIYLVLLFAAAGLFLWQKTNFLFTQTPEIILFRPKEGSANQGESLFVSGRVIPAGSRVWVNGKEASLNGNGVFTAVVNIPMGESVLGILAINGKKEGRLLQVVKRIPTEEEERAKKEEEEQKKREVLNRTAEIEVMVKNLIAAKNAAVSPGEGNKKTSLRIINNRIKEEFGFSSIVGEVANMGDRPVSWVMIAAKFLNQAGQVVDTRYGFATDVGQVLQPGQSAKFETQATAVKFDNYSLELSWEEGLVAGAATEGAPVEEATVSGETKKETL